MSILKVEDAVPPHLFPAARSATWPSVYTSQAGSCSPAIKEPGLPPMAYSGRVNAHMDSHNVQKLGATSGWYGASVVAGDFQYAAYEHYATPCSEVVLDSSTPPALSSQTGRVASSVARADFSGRGLISPVPVYPHIPLLSESAQQPTELPQISDLSSRSSPSHVQHGQELSRQSGHHPVLRSVPSTPSWAVDSLGIHTPADSYDASFAQYVRNMRGGESTIKMPQPTPHSRHGFTPIAPQPVDTPRSTTTKRSREDDETGDTSKRRRRSSSNASSSLELTEEDRLLLKLKDSDSMPWKDIAARFQTELGKQYQIPALQMRLKRLRERMRTWSEADVRALRMAHDYWAQNKFDVIAQKMLEFGAQEKWTPKQCARKWAEQECDTALPTPLPQLDQHAQHSFTPYSMSPAEPATTFLPYMPS